MLTATPEWDDYHSCPAPDPVFDNLPFSKEDKYVVAKSGVADFLASSKKGYIEYVARALGGRARALSRAPRAVPLARADPLARAAPLARRVAVPHVQGDQPRLRARGVPDALGAAAPRALLPGHIVIT